MTDARTAAWMRPVDLGTSAERLEAHDAAADALAGKATAPLAAGLVLLAADGRPGPAFDALAGAVRAADPTFSGVPGDLETRLAASVAAAAVMSKGNAAGAAAAHAVASAAWGGLPLPVPDLARLAEATLAERSEKLRSRRQIVSVLDQKAVNGLTEAFTDEAVSLAGSDGRRISQAVAGTAAAAGRALDRLAAAVSERLAAGEEEVDLLWWAFAGRSETLDAPWSEIAEDGLAAVAAGAEFARLLRYDVRPPSTRAILSRVLAGRADNEVTLSDAAEAAAPLTLPTASEQPLLPVLCSVSEARSFGGEPPWRASVARWSIDPAVSCTVLDLAEQTVRELLLASSSA